MSAPEQSEVVKGARKSQSLRVETEAAQPEEDRSVFHRPHAAQMITKRVVSRVLRGKRPNPPSAEHVRLEKAMRQARQFVIINNSCGQALACVGRDAPDLSLLGVEAESDAAL